MAISGGGPGTRISFLRSTIPPSGLRSVRLVLLTTRATGRQLRRVALREAAAKTPDHGRFVRLPQESHRPTPKVTIPAPTEVHFFGGRGVIDSSAYPNLDEFWSDLLKVFREEIADLAAAGCNYFQFDNCSLALLGDPRFQEAFRREGEDPRALVSRYFDVLNSLFDANSYGGIFAMHLCRGNKSGQWLGTGGYEYIADLVFERVKLEI
jgi:methionine synthase II (cobalamin-independent)